MLPTSSLSDYMKQTFEVLGCSCCLYMVLFLIEVHVGNKQLIVVA